MEKEVNIPFNPQLEAIVNIESGPYGLILAHGSRGGMKTGILPSLSKKLAEKHISCLRFNFPFKTSKSRQIDDVGTLDNAFLSVWQFAVDSYPAITWLAGGIDIGAETAIRSTGLMMTDDGVIPAVIALNYPLYPPNRPEQVDASSLGAIMGDAIFIQGSESNQGSFDRLRNSLRMFAPHADMAKIRGANHDFKVPEKDSDRVAYWISNDIEKFINRIYG